MFISENNYLSLVLLFSAHLTQQTPHISIIIIMELVFFFLKTHHKTHFYSLAFNPASDSALVFFTSFMICCYLCIHVFVVLFLIAYVYCYYVQHFVFSCGCCYISAI